MASANSVKLIVMGVGGVGKSAITIRYTKGNFVKSYDPTIEDTHTHDVELDGRALSLQILDTAGQDEYRSLRETFMHKGDGFLLVYSITDDSTFEDLVDIRQQILGVHENKKVPMILVGNKTDLEDERAVTVEELKRRAAEFGAQYIEVSAKTNANVTLAFEKLLRVIMSKNTDPTKGGGGGSVLGAGATPKTPTAPPERRGPCVLL